MGQPGLDDTCPQCGVQVGDHTIRGWEVCLKAAGFSDAAPYQEVYGGPMMMPGLGDRVPAGGVNLKSGTLDSVLGWLPVLMVSFDSPGAKPMERVVSPEYALVLDDKGMLGVKEMFNQHINRAVQAARSKRK